MNNSKLIDKAQAIAACLSYNDDTNSGNPKEMLRELCHRLGSNTVRIHKKRDGYLMVNLFGSARYLTFMEGTLWRFLKLPPEGMTVEALAASRAQGGGVMSNVKPLSGLSGLTPSMERSTKKFWSELWAAIDSASGNGITTAQVVGMLEVAKAAVIQSHFDDEE